MNKLPPEVTLKILSYLDPPGWFHCSHTCHHWRTLIPLVNVDPSNQIVINSHNCRHLLNTPRFPRLLPIVSVVAKNTDQMTQILQRLSKTLVSTLGASGKTPYEKTLLIYPTLGSIVLYDVAVDSLPDIMRLILYLGMNGLKELEVKTVKGTTNEEPVVFPPSIAMDRPHSSIANLEHLTSLYLSPHNSAYCSPNLTFNSWLLSFLQHCPRLQTLLLRPTRSVPLQFLVDLCPRLGNLWINYGPIIGSIQDMSVMTTATQQQQTGGLRFLSLWEVQPWGSEDNNQFLFSQRHSLIGLHIHYLAGLNFTSTHLTFFSCEAYDQGDLLARALSGFPNLQRLEVYNFGGKRAIALVDAVRCHQRLTHLFIDTKVLTEYICSNVITSSSTLDPTLSTVLADLGRTGVLKEVQLNITHPEQKVVDAVFEEGKSIERLVMTSHDYHEPGSLLVWSGMVHLESLKHIFLESIGHIDLKHLRALRHVETVRLIRCYFVYGLLELIETAAALQKIVLLKCTFVHELSSAMERGRTRNIKVLVVHK